MQSKMNFVASTQRAFWSSFTPVDGVKPAAAAADRERALAVRNYAKVILFMGEKASVRKEVILTAMAYARRYLRRPIDFLNEDYAFTKETCEDALLLAITAFFLAGKVEEEPLPKTPERRGMDLSELLKLAKANKPQEQKKLEISAIRYEMEFLAGINFDLLCFHPLRPAQGYLDAWHRIAPLDEYETVKRELWPYVSGVYLVDDLMFDYPPSALGLACLVCALRKTRRGKSKVPVPDDGDVQPTVRDILANECLVDKLDAAQRIVLDIADQLERGLTKELDLQAKAAYKKWKDGANASSNTPEV